MKRQNQDLNSIVMEDPHHRQSGGGGEHMYVIGERDIYTRPAVVKTRRDRPMTNEGIVGGVAGLGGSAHQNDLQFIDRGGGGGGRDITRLSQLANGRHGGPGLPVHLPPAVPPTVYELDHLATFDISTKTGVSNHEDGIRKLRQLELSSGVWTKRVLLTVDQREVVVVEKTTGKELERFPIGRVVEPTCFTSNRLQDIFNNVVVFIVKSGSSKKFPSVLNLFQCIGFPGQNLVEDIKAASMGKFPRRLTDHQPPVIIDIIQNPLQNLIPPAHERLHASAAHSKKSSGSGSDRGSAHRNLSKEAINGKVATLNRCFDDIELFVADVQETARQTKVTELRNVPLDQSMFKRRFVDVLQKFKLALNLLPQLSQIIRNPGSDELVHSLFALLELTVDICRDSDGKPKFVENIVSPLLHADTCRFLEEHLYPSEKQTWKSLGGAWTIPKEEWSGPLPSEFVPKFRENPVRNGSHSGSSDDSKKGSGRDITPNSVDQNGRPYSVSPPISSASSSTAASGEEKSNRESLLLSQQGFLSDLKSRQCRICVTTHTRQKKDDRELTLSTDEFLEVLDDSKNWWKVRNSRNETGYAPKTILKPYHGF